MQLRAKTPFGWAVRGCLALVACSFIGICMLVTLGMFIATPSSSSTSPVVATAAPGAPQQASQAEPAADSAAALAAITGTDTGDLVVAAQSAYIDSANYLHVVGSLANRGAQARTGIQLQARVEDAAGENLLAADDAAAESDMFEPMLQTIQPGETAPFEYVYDMGETQPARYGVSVKKSEPTDATRPNVQIAQHTLVVQPDGDAYIVGELVNMSETPVLIEQIAGAALDEQAHVVAVSPVEHAATYLAAANDPAGFDRTPFRMYLGPSIPSATESAVYVEAAPTDARPAYKLHTANAQTTYTDVEGNFHVVGSVRNDGPDALSSTLVASLHDTDGKVLDVSSMNMPFDVLAAGAEVPYDFIFLPPDSEDFAGRVARYSVSFDPNLTATHSEAPVAMTATEAGLVEKGAFWFISGTVANPSGQPVAHAEVVATISDRSGKLLGVASTRVFPEGDTFGAEEAAAYETFFNALPGVDMNEVIVTVVAQGYAP